MMSLLKSIITTIIKKVASEIGAVFSRKTASFRKALTLWKLSPEATSIHCFITNSQAVQKERFQTPLYNREDSIAQGLVVSELERVFSNRIEAHYHMSPIKFKSIPELRENLVLIGGPVNNSISSELLSDTVCHNLNFSFDLSVENRDLHYLDANSVSKILKPIQQKHNNFTDWGVILNIRNPWSDSHRLIAFMGCNGLSTLAAAKSIKTQLDKIRKQIKQYDEYAIIVRCSGLWTNKDLRLNSSDIHYEEVIPLNTWHQ